ncbi:hypothetical protein PRIPAC_83102 [Pristionchus pacificus]|uniref:Protein arginine N-methyltransferase domain-containing protein n=1 Tax=Pristionchus pacificus TaxID=54126 RepID=A0A2A6BKE7_PRIPA|nr:hypothetical protein PRIPAC_83102 [Pristionchus pacificus]|eukprot:PDM66379.1 hypothetical protein PRIPAC_47796 [Pristionchus pacificus]
MYIPGRRGMNVGSAYTEAGLVHIEHSRGGGTEIGSKGQRRHAAPNDMTSKDYYFDSYAHFGIHEVCLFLSVPTSVKCTVFLLSQTSVVDSRQVARARGSAFPRQVKLFITAIEDRQYKEDKINWWDNVREMAITEPLVDVVENNQVVTGNYCVKEDALTVKKGEELKGVFTCASNARNERDLDFNIKVSFHGEVCDLEKESTYTLH